MEPRVSGSEVVLLVGGARAQEVLGLMRAHWWVELGPSIFGCMTLVVPEMLSVYSSESMVL